MDSWMEVEASLKKGIKEQEMIMMRNLKVREKDRSKQATNLTNLRNAL